MKVAVIGSRKLSVNIDDYMPCGITLIISGGAKGIDSFAEIYADSHGIEKTIIPPDYGKYGKAAPLIRNRLIVESADTVIAFWDGKSKGTKFAIEYAKKKNKNLIVYLIE